MLHLPFSSHTDTSLNEVCFTDQAELLLLIRLPFGWGGSGHHQLLGMLPDLEHWSLYVMLLDMYELFKPDVRLRGK